MRRHPPITEQASSLPSTAVAALPSPCTTPSIVRRPLPLPIASGRHSAIAPSSSTPPQSSPPSPASARRHTANSSDLAFFSARRKNRTRSASLSLKLHCVAKTGPISYRTSSRP
ncbi:hypothetical protein U1Q18_042200 [Sarracenia purpurea var. burkii]